MIHKFNKDIFKPASKEEIKQRQEKYLSVWISEFVKRSDVTKNPDGSYDVDENVDLEDMNLTKIPIKFRKVTGFFNCDHNKLVTFENCPKYVGSWFDCSDNQLTTLETCPEYVDGFFSCSYNKLTTLEGSPKHVGGDFYCNNNQLTTLEGSPKYVGRDFWCIHNNLTTLKGIGKVKGKVKSDMKESKMTEAFNEMKYLAGILNENLVDHAKYELKIAGLFDKDSDYNGMLGQAVMELMKVFANQEHSGFSAQLTRELFNKLANYEALSDITDNPDEWMCVSEYNAHNENWWQNKRNPSVFSTDNGKTYYHLDNALNKGKKCIGHYGAKNNLRVFKSKPFKQAMEEHIVKQMMKLAGVI